MVALGELLRCEKKINIFTAVQVFEHFMYIY